MWSFLIALVVLVVGYFTYGVIVERVFGVDKSRTTPAYTHNDGVDYVPMSPWRVFLIQFLNIAGLGPIFGAIMGIQFGPSAFLWIALGTIFAGGVHDFFSGMLSVRDDGSSQSEYAGKELGNATRQLLRLLSVLLLVLIGAVFVINPAKLLANLCDGALDGFFSVTFWIIAIFTYYILATLVPIDKVIGRFYPIFGFIMLFMAIGLLVVLFAQYTEFIPEFTDGLHNRYADPESHPIFPMMFVSIACGAISGFHSTQSPLMARCIENERYGRPIFYGAMVAEGIVALIWAAATIAFFRGDFTALGEYIHKAGSAAPLVNDLCVSWLGTLGGILAILGVVAAPITSGDTALRSARLIVADTFKIKQDRIGKRLLISVPLFIAASLIMSIEYESLWRYFGWTNQLLATFTLWAIAMWLLRHDKAWIIALLPAIFMTMVTSSYIFVAPEGIPLNNPALAYIIAAVVTASVTVWFLMKVRAHRNGRL